MKNKRNRNKIEKLRKKIKERKEIRRAIEATIIRSEEDRRPYVEVDVNGTSIVGLLDSGASVSCLGGDAISLVDADEVESLDEGLRTADGKVQAIIGRVKARIQWRQKTVELILYLVPSLKQKLYLGIDFWEMFGLAPTVLAEISIDNANMVELSAEQRQRLEHVKNLFPPSTKLGLGRTHLMEHVIEVYDETVPIKQRYYPISPVKQKFAYEEIDRMLELGVIEESDSAWSSPIVLVQKPGKNRLRRHEESQRTYQERCIPNAAC